MALADVSAMEGKLRSFLFDFCLLDKSSFSLCFSLFELLWHNVERVQN